MNDIAAKVGQSVAEAAASGPSKGMSVGGDSSFSKILGSKMEGQEDVTKQVLEAFGMSPTEGMKVQSIPADGLDIRVDQITSAQDIRTQDKAMELLGGVNRSALQMEHMVEWMTSATSVSLKELLAAQVGVGQILLEIETTNKIIEMGTSGVKSIWQTNIA